MLIKKNPSVIEGFLEDSSNLTGGSADTLYIPENPGEIRQLVLDHNTHKAPLTVSAGQTGTTGGCIPFGGDILSTQKLNKIINIDKTTMSAIVEPGVTLEELEKAVAKEGLLYPPDPTEKSATLGGNVSTNASGGRCYRFGSTRNWIKRLGIILPDGQTLNLKRSSLPIYHHELKNAAGYYNKPGMEQIDLFIGSEGTLGVISEIELALIPALKETLDLVAFFPSEEKAVDFVTACKQTNKLTNLQTVNFFEFFDENTLEMLRPSYPRIPSFAKAAIYVEQENIDLDPWLELLEKYGAKLEDCWLATNEKQKIDLQKFRHAIPEHVNEIFKQHHQVKLATDIAVPEGKFKEMFSFYNSELPTPNSELFFIKFGHIGDNHLHVNLVAKKPEDFPLAKELVTKFVRKAVELGGTVSAEHGIGKIKHPYLKVMYGEAGIEKMINLKKTYDPNCLLGLDTLFSRNLLKSRQF